jgi:hypothetical protein
MAGSLAQAERDAGRKEPKDIWLGRQIAKQPWAKNCKLTHNSIRKLLPKLRDTWAAVVDGRADRTQWQCFEEVLPILHKVARSRRSCPKRWCKSAVMA